MSIIDISEYKYKYELHSHTVEASACARIPGAELARVLKDAGYTGVVITNHAWGGNTCVDRSLPFREWVKQYASGYEKAKEEGDKIGLQVFFGWEAGYNATEFLIYGLGPEWLMDHPELWEADIHEQYRIVHEAGGLVIHAHPFREEYYIPEIRLFPDDVDGVEIVNATHSSHLSKSHNDPNFDTLAIAYAKEHNFITTAGSDIHNAPSFGGGIILKKPINCYSELVEVIRNRGDYLITNGDHYYTRTGDLII